MWIEKHMIMPILKKKWIAMERGSIGRGNGDGDVFAADGRPGAARAGAGGAHAQVAQYGEYVDKTATARILGVTRATVYAMLADGRIEGACSGRRVAVRSIARYMATPKSRGTKTRPA